MTLVFDLRPLCAGYTAQSKFAGPDTLGETKEMRSISRLMRRLMGSLLL